MTLTKRAPARQQQVIGGPLGLPISLPARPVAAHREVVGHAILVRRLVSFCSIGLTAVVLGTSLQWQLVSSLGPGWSYAIQALAPIEASWALNRWLTWPDRDAGPASLLKWNAQHAVMTILGCGIYLSLLRVTGMSWLWASIMMSAAFAPVSYLVADKWSFAPAAETVVRRSTRPREHFPIRHHWILAGIVTVQAALSLHLVWSNTAFSDEALYLWSGHLEWAHWLRGTPIPPFPTYFSGAPVVYPPLAALADTYGGLAGARLLSLLFMLGATAFAAAVAARLYGSRAGLFAAAVCAGLGATQFLGAFATFDAMALFLLALATWLVVRAADADGAARIVLLLAAGIAIALADAAKYAAGLFDLVVVAVAALACLMAGRSRKASLSAGVVTALSLGVCLLLALKLGGQPYLHGIESTTLDRPHGTASVKGITADSIGWAGLVAILALIGVIVSAFRSRRAADWLLAGVLAGAIVLAPADQARIRVFTSLFKHVGFGAWFAGLVAGLALSALADSVPRIKQRQALCASACAAAALMVLGASLSGTHFASWPDSTRFVRDLRSVLPDHRGKILATDGSLNVIEYYLPQDSSASLMYGGEHFHYFDLATGKQPAGNAAYADAIRHQFFAVIALPFDDPTAPDHVIWKDIQTYGGYRLVAVIPYQANGTKSAYRIWVRSR